MLGFPVPVKRLRETLAKPLHKTAHAIDTAESTPDENGEVLSIEERISDDVDTLTHKVIKKVESIGVAMPQAVQEALEVILNISFNEDFRLNGPRLKAAAEEVGEWRQNYPGSDENVMHLILTNAPFFARHFCLHQLKEAIDESTDDELETVGRDLETLYEIMLSMHRLLLAWMRDMPSEAQPTMQEFASIVFVIGRVFALAVLSLRRHGLDEIVDFVLTKAREEVKATENIEIDPAWTQEFAVVMNNWQVNLKERNLPFI